MTEEKRAGLKRLFPNHADKIDSASEETINRLTTMAGWKASEPLLGMKQSFVEPIKLRQPILPPIGAAFEGLQAWRTLSAASVLSPAFKLQPPFMKWKALSALPKLPVFQTIDWEKLHGRDERALRFAAQQNWFIQPEAPYSITSDIDECGTDIEQLNQIMVDSTTELLTTIFQRLARNYPGRKHILEEVFLQHSEGRYLMSLYIIHPSPSRSARSVSAAANT